ncbi:unnamed protein product [Lactuca saligna]|uniref:Uncharacterized protein n=1 Tax=Lactuca saligna TaxID=75948 RepID=A0AA35YDP5_LACSI|nr:unnamed protein product [Lactuca saligna]
MKSLPIVLYILPPRLYEKGGKKRPLKHEELHKAHTYILLNCVEVAPFITEFDRAAQASYQNEPISVLRDKYFAEWFKYKVTRDSTDGSAKHLEPLANGPSNNARSYNGYFVNGYKFHTQEYDELKDLWTVVKTKPRGVYEVTKAETEVALDGSTEANGVFHLDEWFELPNEVNVSERLNLASNRTNFEQISSNESESSEAENQEDDTDEDDRDEPFYFDYYPDEDKC